MIIWELIKHNFLLLYRSAFFGKSLAIRLFLGFFLLIVFVQLYFFALGLPTLLNEFLPGRAPLEWVLGVLPVVFIFDFTIRLMVQKLPALNIHPYLHIPVPRGYILLLWVMRLIFHPINFYLFFFFIPFLRQADVLQSGQQVFLLLVVIGGLVFSQFLHVWVMLHQAHVVRYLVVSVFVALLGFFYSFFPEQSITAIYQFLITLSEGNLVNILLVLFLVAIPVLAVLGVFRKIFYYIYEQKQDGTLGANLNYIEKKLLSVPRWGDYWLFEWRLNLRNKRSKGSFSFFILISVAVFIYFAFFSDMLTEDPGTLVIIMLLMTGGYGFNYFQHVFSWDSHYADYLFSRDITVRELLMARYYFYIMYALVQFVVISIVILIAGVPGFIGVYFSTMLYVLGFGFYLYIRAGISHSTRFDPDGRASFNMEGITGMKFLISLIFFVSAMPFVLIAQLLSIPWLFMASIGFVGLLFLVFHRYWIRGIAKRYEKEKYRNLSIYREK